MTEAQRNRDRIQTANVLFTQCRVRNEQLLQWSYQEIDKLLEFVELVKATQSTIQKQQLAAVELLAAIEGPTTGG